MNIATLQATLSVRIIFFLNLSLRLDGFFAVCALASFILIALDTELKPRHSCDLFICERERSAVEH